MDFEREKKHLIRKLKKDGVLKSKRVIEAMKSTPREKFLPKAQKHRAYLDRPLQIGEGQTISAPHMNAMMCEILEISPGEKILEVGTGSGYHAALIAYLTGPTGKIFTIERHEDLAKRAEERIKDCGFNNVKVIYGDGTLGYEKEKPFDKILVTAASPKIPQPLLDQLHPNNGILCIPLGKRNSVQALYKVIKESESIKSKRITGVMFVPLIGKYGCS